MNFSSNYSLKLWFQGEVNSLAVKGFFHDGNHELFDVLPYK